MWKLCCLIKEYRVVYTTVIDLLSNHKSKTTKICLDFYWWKTPLSWTPNCFRQRIATLLNSTQTWSIITNDLVELIPPLRPTPGSIPLSPATWSSRRVTQNPNLTLREVRSHLHTSLLQKNIKKGRIRNSQAQKAKRRGNNKSKSKIRSLDSGLK